MDGRRHSDKLFVTNATKDGTTKRETKSLCDSNGNNSEWNRAIPEAGYITLGTIRYGVKLAANDFDRYANDRKNVSANSTPNNKVTNEETEADLSDVSSTACRKGCCCINGSKLPLPKNAIDGKKAQNELNPNSTAKNRTHDCSEHQSTTSHRSKPIQNDRKTNPNDIHTENHFVDKDNCRESSASPVCCYTTNSKVKSISIVSPHNQLLQLKSNSKLISKNREHCSNHNNNNNKHSNECKSSNHSPLIHENCLDTFVPRSFRHQRSVSNLDVEWSIAKQRRKAIATTLNERNNNNNNNNYCDCRRICSCICFCSECATNDQQQQQQQNNSLTHIHSERSSTSTPQSDKVKILQLNERTNELNDKNNSIKNLNKTNETNGNLQKLICCSTNVLIANKQTAKYFTIGDREPTKLRSALHQSDNDSLNACQKIHCCDCSRAKLIGNRIDHYDRLKENNNNNNKEIDKDRPSDSYIFKCRYVPNHNLNGKSIVAYSTVSVTSVPPSSSSSASSSNHFEKSKLSDPRKSIADNNNQNKSNISIKQQQNQQQKQQHNQQQKSSASSTNDAHIDSDLSFCSPTKLNLADSVKKQQFDLLSHTNDDTNETSLCSVSKLPTRSKPIIKTTSITTTTTPTTASNVLNSSCKWPISSETNTKLISKNNGNFMLKENIAQSDSTIVENNLVNENSFSNLNKIQQQNNVDSLNNGNDLSDRCVYFDNKAIPVFLVDSNGLQHIRRISLENPSTFSRTDYRRHSERTNCDFVAAKNHQLIQSIERYTDHKYDRPLTDSNTSNLIAMERRKNTLDRWQRLRFGRRSTSSPPEDKIPQQQQQSQQQQTNSDIVDAQVKRSSDKSERLRELTELLKGGRHQSIPPNLEGGSRVPPPLPPPRKPHTLSPDNSGCVEKFIDTSASESGSPIATLRSEHAKSKETKPNTLRPNASTSNLDLLKHSYKLPSPKDNSLFKEYVRPNENDKTPMRSASFSQVDYSSGKYIRSAFGALRALTKSKIPPVVDNTNLTLPRSRRDRSRTPSPCPDRFASVPSSPPANDLQDIWIPLKPPSEKGDKCSARNELNLNLLCVDPSDVIMEEDNENSPTADSRESQYVVPQSPPTCTSKETPTFKVIAPSEQKIDALSKEEGLLSSPEEFFQTASTCMIPVPVYECTARDWVTADLGDQWINACEIDGAKIVDELLSNQIEQIEESIPIVVQEQCEITIKNESHLDEIAKIEKKARSPTLELDNVPAIAVTPGSSVSESFDEVDAAPSTAGSEKGENETENQINKTSDNSNDYVVEVRKRHSKDSDNTQSTSGSGTSSPKSGNLDDKRRIDKTKRRKGIYIQWAALDKANKELLCCETPQESSGLDDIGRPIWPTTFECNTSPIEHKRTNSSLESESDADCELLNVISSKAIADKLRMELSCISPDEAQTPASLEPTTPDSEYGRPVWPKSGTAKIRRQSFSLQSSEEKDESPSSPKSKPYNKIFMIRSDSISDNEMSDRTPSYRDRASQSPAPNDGDLKRYSKRPLRGPYGQMLEAEMKKPNKQNYDGLLQELNRSESSYMLSPKHRDDTLQSCDDIASVSSRSSKSSTKARKSHSTANSLPIPTHTRAASTPAHTEKSQTEVLSQHRRSPSCVESISSHQSTSDSGYRKDGNKKISMENFSTTSYDERDTKRASSETKEKLTTKRNSSSPAAISLLNFTNEKLEKLNLNDLSRHKTHKHKSSLKATPELLAELLRGSSEKMATAEQKKKNNDHTVSLPNAVLRCLDTRTHIVVELFNTEKSYVDSLETVVSKYLNALKMQENASIIDVQTVDEIFLMVPNILQIHQQFLDELRCRLDAWEPLQRVGDSFVKVFSTAVVLETYTLFVNNVNRAKTAIRSASNQRPAFARFLEAMAREHKGKLTLDTLLIKPVQKFPNYELMFSRLIKHTDDDHPDQKPLQEALKLVHDILLHLNCKEREALENDQREAALRELEGVIEGISDLVSGDRQFLLFDLVSMPTGQGGRKERGFFLFNDLLIITSIKRRSGTIKKPSTTCPTSVASTLDTNKYKLLMKISIEDLDIIKAKDENIRKIMREMTDMADDCNKLQQILEIVVTLRCQHQLIEENVRDMQKELQRQLADRQTNDSQLCILELSVNPARNGQQQHMTVVFPKSEKRAQWEKTFYEIKQKLNAALDHQPIPEFVASIPIRKTRAGLQFTCAASTLGAQKDVWVCNSDGYVGQVCVLSLMPEPTVTSCNGVCNARILCVASVPAYDASKFSESSSSIGSSTTSSRRSGNSGGVCLEKKTSNVSTKSIASNDSSGGGTNSERDIQLDSSSSSSDSDELEQNKPLRRLDSTKASSTPQLSSSAPNSTTDMVAAANAAAAGEMENDARSQPTMWLGTEDGCIHVYNCTDNIRTKKNKIKIQQVSAVYSILYLDNRVFVSLANGDLVVYTRDHYTWNTTSPQTISLGSVTNPVSKLLNVHGKLWCSIQGLIKIINTTTLQVENHIQISSDIKPITNMAVYNNQVWISVQNSAQIKCYHSRSYILLFEVNLAPSVNKMLSNCDDIIRQHKAACLRVTSLLACKDLIWIGTSAGVILTISASNYKSRNSSSSSYNTTLNTDHPIVTGIPYGHTGHVRFLTCVDYIHDLNRTTIDSTSDDLRKKSANNIGKSQRTITTITTTTKTTAAATKTNDSLQNLLIISGGDGYEDFRNSGTNSVSEVAGREDSTNHLLLWQV